MINYLVSDFIIRLKNASMANRKTVILPYSKLNLAIGKVLVTQGFLDHIKEEEKDGKKSLTATIKFEKRELVMTGIAIVSKPSLRVYSDAKNISKHGKHGLETLVMTTSLGVMSGNDAKKKGVGGEILFTIW